MSTLPEAFGDLAQGVLTAHAVEPAGGESSGHSHESACLNCGTALVGTHCHACGQAAHVHKTLGAFFHDLLHGVFHFEGKIWRTLPLLAWDPGRLTREYVDGRRASYVSPIALFLFVVFLTFAVFHAVGNPVNLGGVTVNRDGQGIDAAIARARADVARLEASRTQAVAAHKPTEAIDDELDSAKQALGGIEAVKAKKLPGVIASATDGKGREAANRINERWAKVKENPDLALYKLQSSAYKYSWLLIPLSLPFVWLLFPFNRRFGLYDHTVFVTYSLSFMFLLLTVLSVLSGWNPWGAAGGAAMLLLAYAPFHMYRQLRGTYALGRFGALWRTGVLSIFALVVVTCWAMALLGMVMAE